jgi:hypothetical protein
MSWWRNMLERWRWQPPREEVEAKEQRADDLHRAAIEARQSFETQQATTRPLIARVERMAAAYLREERAEARERRRRAAR